MIKSTKTAHNSDMYKIIVEGVQGKREININKNLTISNIIANF